MTAWPLSAAFFCLQPSRTRHGGPSRGKARCRFPSLDCSTEQGPKRPRTGGHMSEYLHAKRASAGAAARAAALVLSLALTSGHALNAQAATPARNETADRQAIEDLTVEYSY